MITNRYVWLEKKVGIEEFHKVASMEIVQRVSWVSKFRKCFMV